MIKVFLGGEGHNDVAVAEALLHRVRATEWAIDGTRHWKDIRKYRAGAAARRAEHADAHAVLGLVLEAYENACEMLAFVRDHDGDGLREQEIRRALADLPSFDFAKEFKYELAVVGSLPRPKLEGWILCLLGIHGTDGMTSARADRELAAVWIAAKSSAAYIAIVEAADLPKSGSLADWLAQAEAAFRSLIDGQPG